MAHSFPRSKQDLCDPKGERDDEQTKNTLYKAAK
jgi:hypothetical protein